MAELAEALNIVVGRGVLHRCREKHRLLLKLPLEKLLLLRVGYAEHHCNSRNYSDQRNDERSAENSFRHTRSLCYVNCLVAYSADSLDHAAAVSELHSQRADMYVHGAALAVEIVTPDLRDDLLA